MNLPGLDLTNIHSHVLQNLSSFSKNHQCQSTKLLNPNSSADEHVDYLLTVNFLINYIDESCITQES